MTTLAWKKSSSGFRDGLTASNSAHDSGKHRPINYCPAFLPFITAERDDYFADATVIYRPMLTHHCISNQPGSRLEYGKTMELQLRFSLCIVLLIVAVARGDDWPAFRGPTGLGYSPARYTWIGGFLRGEDSPLGMKSIPARFELDYNDTVSFSK